MKRNIAALIAAVLTGGVVVFAGDALGHLIYTPRPGLDLSNRDVIVEYMNSLPLGALLFVAVAQAAGAFSGGFVSGIIARNKITALIYGVIALTMGVMNLAAVPHPLWLSVLLVILPVPCALLGFHLSTLLVGVSAVDGRADAV